MYLMCMFFAYLLVYVIILRVILILMSSFFPKPVCVGFERIEKFDVNDYQLHAN